MEEKGVGSGEPGLCTKALGITRKSRARGAACNRQLEFQEKRGIMGMEAIMELPYTYEKGEKFLVGHLDEYPEYPTQGVDLKDLEEHLQDIYSMIQDGTLEPKRHGILKIA